MHTQRGEEPHILKACEGIERGRFLDIGAWNAIDKSNTRALFELGWGGVSIEPSPGPVRELVREYGDGDRVEVVSAAVGMDSGIFPIRVTDDAVSGNTGHAWREKGGFYGTLLVPHFTIKQILDRFGRFDMVSIDTEGSSVDLLKVLLATEMFPACIVVEHDDRIAEAARAAQDRHYRAVHISEENLVFVRE